MKKIAALLVITIASLFGQEGQPVSQTPLPATATAMLNYYSGANLIYTCIAKSNQNAGTGAGRVSTITVSAASNANPVSFSATAHNIGDYGTLGATLTPTVKITGGTGNWTVINGTWTATPTSANAFTIPVDSTSLGALTGTLVVTTAAPLTNSTVWAVRAYTYSGANLVSSAWANKAGGAGGTNLTGGSVGMSFACSSRTTLSYQ